MRQSNISKIETLDDLNLKFIFDILGPGNNVMLADEIFISNGKGEVLSISKSYEQKFGFQKDSIVGRSVFDLEAEGVFTPCITATVIRQRKKIISTQVIKSDGKHSHNVLTTGIPIFGDNGMIKYVVCFNTITLEQVNSIREEYDKLQESIRHYTSEDFGLLHKKIFLPEMIFNNKEMIRIWDTIHYTSATKANILITGETGVGKSLVAKGIHKISDRSTGPFVAINCATINENLIESELFGYDKGAFTGANTIGKVGKIELADKGTLFLDEIGEIPLTLQAKLLQVIQEKTFTRVSGIKPISVDFKLIVATNRNLEEAVANGSFRKDLYYRLNVLRIHIPPIRERREDICPLSLNFLSKFNKEYNKNLSFSPRLLDYFEQHDWPGNVRQLENLIERLVITCNKVIIDIIDLPYDFSKSDFIEQSSSVDMTLSHLIDSFERDIILKSYHLHKTSTAVANHLGISQTTAARKIRKYVNNIK